MQRAQEAVDAHAGFRERVMSAATGRLPEFLGQEQGENEASDAVEEENDQSLAAGNDAAHDEHGSHGMDDDSMEEKENDYESNDDGEKGRGEGEEEEEEGGYGSGSESDEEEDEDDEGSYCSSSESDEDEDEEGSYGSSSESDEEGSSDDGEDD